MGLEINGVASLAHALSDERGVDIKFEGSWPVTDGLRVRVPLFEGDGDFMVGLVDAMSAVAAHGSRALLLRANRNALMSQLYCGIEAGRCAPKFAKSFEGSAAHIELSNHRWQRLMSGKTMDVLSMAVASVGLGAFGEKNMSSISQGLWASHPKLYARLSRVDRALDSFLLARDFCEAFKGLPGAEERMGEAGMGEEEREARAGSGRAGSAGRKKESGAGEPAEAEEGCAPGERSEKKEPKKSASKGKAPWAKRKDEGGAAKLSPKYTDHDESKLLDGKGSAKKEQECAREVGPAVRAMVAKFERALKTKEQIKWRFERERGEIDTRSLAKLQASPGFKAPFKSKQVFESAAVAVHVLIDLSGSMCRGGRVDVAAKTAMALAMAMKRLDIDCEVGGFSSGACQEYVEREGARGAKGGVWMGRAREKLVVRRFKSFGKASLRGLSLIELDDEAAENPDGEGVAWAASSLMENPRRRKILMVLSDGEPATGDTPSSWLEEDLSARLAAMRRAGIETVGVGIQTDAVKTFYDDHVVVNDLQGLVETALGQLSKILMRGAGQKRG